jgi:hypothetical protein
MNPSMSGSALGGLLGLANLVAITMVIAVVERAGARDVITVVMLCALPAILVGALFGALASRLRGAHVLTRVIMIALPALMLVVVVAGMFRLPNYLLFACVPTTVAALVLERRTRVSAEAASDDERVADAPKASAQGVLLGICNVIVIACGMQLMGAAEVVGGGASIAGGVVFAGLLPGAVTGAVLGGVAYRYRTATVPVRRALIVLPALLVVVGLAGAADLMMFSVPAFVPTVCAALILERRTRRTVLPIAQAL